MSGDEVTQLQAAIDAVAALDPSELTTAEGLGQLLEDLGRCLRRLDFELHRILRSFDARGDGGPLGYATTGQFARHRLGMSDREAAATVRLSRELAFVPETARRWAAGDVDADRVRVVASARTERTEEAFAEWERWFADQAATLDLRGLRVTVKRWHLRVDPESDEPERRDAERDAHVPKTFQDTVVVDATLDVLGGAVFKRVFDDLVEELFKADWAQAKERLGREPTMLDLARTPAQRRADALVLMAERAHSADPSQAARLRPLVTVVAGIEAMAVGLAELWDRTPLSAAQLAAVLARDRDIERYVFGSGEVPIAYNERSRLFTGKLRRAIQVRDRHCTGLGCDRPAERCDVDHIEPVAAGGLTRGRTGASPAGRTTGPGRAGASAATPTRPDPRPGIAPEISADEEGSHRTMSARCAASTRPTPAGVPCGRAGGRARGRRPRARTGRRRPRTAAPRGAPRWAAGSRARPPRPRPRRPRGCASGT